MACPFYRERWLGDGEVYEGRSVLYDVICLQNTPPATIDEQQDCLEARTSCWRLRTTRKRPTLADDDDDSETEQTSAGEAVSA